MSGLVKRKYHRLLEVLGFSSATNHNSPEFIQVQFAFLLLSITSISWISYFIYYVTLHTPHLHIYAGIALGSTFVALWILYRWHNWQWAILQVAITSHAMLTLIGFSTGGPFSPLFIWILANASGFIFVFTIRHTILFAVGALLTILVVFGLSVNASLVAYEFPFSLLSHEYHLFQVSNMLFGGSALFVTSFLGRYFFMRGVKDTERATQIKTDFLSTMSHEIRTPLNGLMGMISLLKQSDLDSSQKEYLTMMSTASESLIKMVNNILDYTKLNAEKMEVVQEPFALDPILEEVRALFGPLVQEKNLQLSTFTAENLPPVYIGDSEKIKQILINLVGNALKFTFEGTIKVVVYSKSDLLCFEVRDSGVGIAADRKNLFSPFSQEDSTTTRDYGGTGLGLAISHQLVILMGGSIWFESTKGVGTTFLFNLPLSKGDISDIAPVSVQSSMPQALFEGSPKVLLVEDNQVNEMVATKLLEASGCEVCVAHNGKEALAKAEEEVFTLILMDLHMPEMDGVEAPQKIRNYEGEHGRESIPIVAVTATVSESQHKQCLDVGMQAVLTKPYTYDALVTVLELYLVENR